MYSIQYLFFFPHSRFFLRLVVGTLLLMVVVAGIMLEGVAGFPIAHASGGQANFALQPVTYDPNNPATASDFVFDSKPGIVIKSRVRVTNAGTATGTVGLYGIDATTGQTSGAVYLNQDAPRLDVGAWISSTYRN